MKRDYKGRPIEDEEVPKPRRKRLGAIREALAQEQQAGPSTGDVIKHELGLHNWSGKQFVVIGAMLLVVIGIFMVRYQGKTGAIVAGLTGEDPPSIQARVRSIEGPTILTAETSEGQKQVVLAGLRPTSSPCVKGRAERKLRALVGKRVTLAFDSKLGQEQGGALVAYLIKPGGKAVNLELLSRGLVRLDPKAKRANHAALLVKAQRQAKRKHAGRWGCR